MATLAHDQFFEQTVIPIRLSCQDQSGWPVVLSLWYLHEDGDLYCATPKSARVVTYLTREPRCAFEIAADQPPYCGIRGRALATIDEDRGVEILERLLTRYLGGTDNSLAQNLLSRSQTEVAIRLEPQTFHSWDFSKRMTDLFQDPPSKPCPE